MTTDRHIEVYRLVRLHGCSLRETGEMLEIPVTGERVRQLLNEVYDEYPDLRPPAIQHEIISYDLENNVNSTETF